jgi:hypothetical protein
MWVVAAIHEIAGMDQYITGRQRWNSVMQTVCVGSHDDSQCDIPSWGWMLIALG